MLTLEIIFYILIAFYVGLFAGIFLAYKLKQLHEEERISADDVDEWMEEENKYCSE